MTILVFSKYPVLALNIFKGLISPEHPGQGVFGGILLMPLGPAGDTNKKKCMTYSRKWFN